MKNVLERFEKLAAAHQMNEACAAAMRDLLQGAHTAGYSAHMAVANAADANEDEEQDSVRETEPDGLDEEEATERMVRAVRKAVKKEVRKAVRKHLQRIAPLAQ